MSPRVSVILPTFNRERTIGRALESVLNQTGVSFEIIIVDDASTDNTLKAISDYLDDDRVRLVRNTVTSGGAAARNRGLEVARGELIAFQDSDDEWLSGKLALQVERLDQCGPEYAGNYTSFIRVANNQAQYLPRIPASEAGGSIFRALIRQNHITTQALLLRRSVVEEVGGFDRELPRFQDWDLALRIASRWLIAYIDQPTVVLYDTPGNLTSFPLKDIPARERILSKWQDRAELTPEMRAHHEHTMSRILLNNREPREAFVHARRAMANRPFSLKHASSLIQTGTAMLFSGKG